MLYYIKKGMNAHYLHQARNILLQANIDIGIICHALWVGLQSALDPKMLCYRAQYVRKHSDKLFQNNKCKLKTLNLFLYYSTLLFPFVSSSFLSLLQRTKFVAIAWFSKRLFHYLNHYRIHTDITLYYLFVYHILCITKR